MKDIIKYWPALLIIAAFLFGRYSKDDTSPELLNKLEQERKAIEQSIIQDRAEMAAKSARQQARAERWYIDSLEMASAIQAKERANNQLRKENEKINLRMASIPLLDSIGESLYPR